MDPHPNDDSRSLSHGAVLIALGFGAIAFWNAFMLVTDYGSKNWPTTTGTIKELRTVFNYFDCASLAPPYVVAVRYIYDVNGTYYSGETEFHGYKTQQAADGAQKSYMYGGGGMLVHYNPWFQWESTLSPGSGASSYLVGLCVFGLLALSVSMSRMFMPESGTSPLPD